MFNKYQKTISLRLKTEDMYNLNRIKYFWEREDKEKYTYSDIIRTCLWLICRAEDEKRQSNKSDT